MKKQEGPKKHYKLSIFFIALVAIAGGLLLTALIYLQVTGQFAALTEAIREIVAQNTIYGILILFWVIIIPLMLVLIFVLNLFRRDRFKKIKKGWEDAARIVAEKEAAARKREEEKKKQTISRFGTLNSYDHKSSVRKADQAALALTLGDFCDNFRMFAAQKFRLYYDISVIRQFVAGLAVSHLMILQGMSGTGKTSIAYAFGEFLGNSSEIVPVQPVWKERTDLLGYYNEFTKKYNETPFLQKMYQANASDKLYVVVLDELNIARVEYYFAEFLSLLEIPDPNSRYLEVVPDRWPTDPAGLQNGRIRLPDPNSRYLEVVPDRWPTDPAGLQNGRIRLPDNMWFIGTANNDDSTFAISDKVYDRAMVINLDSKAEPFLPDGDEVRCVPISAAGFRKLIASAQAGYEITNRNMRRLRELDEYLIEKFQITFGNRIMRQIKDYISVYVGCGGDEMEALDDIISKKVLRKLEMQNAVYVKNQAEALCNYLCELFGETKVPKCIAYVRRVARNA